MTIAVISLIAAALTHAAALVAGAYLHYRFGARTVRTAKIVASAFRS